MRKSPLQPPNHCAWGWPAIFGLIPDTGATYNAAPGSGRAATDVSRMLSTSRLRSQPALLKSLSNRTETPCGPSFSGRSAA